MAAQAVLIGETIAGMKKAIARRDSASDSDESVSQPTNRGNKLKRKARYVREGQLDPPNGPRVYRRKIDHAGYKRVIISRNPRRYDEYGYELEDDEADEDADAAAAEGNAYADIHLEHTLAPLAAATDLPNHPSLSTPYLSKILTGMAHQASDMVHKERASLWRTKQLLTKFRDETWVPCGVLETENDIALFGSLQETRAKIQSEAAQGEKEPGPPVGGPDTTDQAMTEATTPNVGDEDAEAVPNGTEEAAAEARGDNEAQPKMPEDVSMVDPSIEVGEMEKANGEVAEKSVEDTADGDGLALTAESKTSIEDGDGPTATADGDAESKAEEQPEAAKQTVERGQQDPANGEEDAADKGEADGVPNKPNEADGEADAEEEAEEEDEESQPAPHRMTTRAQAQAASDPTPSAHEPSFSASEPVVHPMFLVPASARPDRDFGLPAHEAEETRRLLLSYVQKQEEVCRGSDRLHAGLLRADRLRRTVLRWAKAEAHVGEMSDGEDWYDKDEWGLEEDLKKGHEEDEDDGGAGTQGKKTRGRRA